MIVRYEFARDGGLMSYGADSSESFKRAAALVPTGPIPAICRSSCRPATPLVINLKTAKATGLEIPPTMLALADEVIE